MNCRHQENPILMWTNDVVIFSTTHQLAFLKVLDLETTNIIIILKFLNLINNWYLTLLLPIKICMRFILMIFFLFSNSDVVRLFNFGYIF